MENIHQRKWITPFARQVCVVLGASLNMSQMSLVVGFTARLLPQLRRPDSQISVDDSAASWIASAMGISLIAGNLAVVPVMGKCGRRLAGIISNVITLIGWIWLSFAGSVTSIIMARTLQGIGLGMVTCVSPIVIGECSSPANRAAFIGVMGFIFALQTMLVHTVGSYLHWQITALVSSGATFANLIMLVLSPESPCWLANQGKYEECRKVFRSLRGKDADDELDKLIEASKINRNNTLMESSLSIAKDRASSLILVQSYLRIVKLREFYIPVIIMFNFYILGQWCGLNMIIGFTEEFLYWIVGPDTNFGLQILLLDINRLLTNLIGIYIAKKYRRRLLLCSTVGANVVILILITGYSYVKVNQMLTFDRPLIGIILGHLLMSTIALGALPLPITISGEIYPSKYKSFTGGLCTVLFSVNFFLATKTFGFTLNTLGLHGTCLVYAILTGLSLALTLVFLPETKDRTLQEIEDKLKGKNRLSDENDPTRLLTTKGVH